MKKDHETVEGAPCLACRWSPDGGWPCQGGFAGTCGKYNAWLQGHATGVERRGDRLVLVGVLAIGGITTCWLIMSALEFASHQEIPLGRLVLLVLLALAESITILGIIMALPFYKHMEKEGKLNHGIGE